MNDTQFYTYKDGTKVEICKACLTMHLDNFDEDTYLWLLEKLDIPYIPEEWNILRDRAYARDPHKMTGLSVFGKYLSTMKLKQYKKFGYKDSEEARQAFLKTKAPIQKPEINSEYEAQIQKQFEEGKISEAEYKTLSSSLTQHENESPYSPIDPTSASSTFYNEEDFMRSEDLPDPAASLTEDDKIYLAMKWGRLYKPNEWIELEKKYKEMEDSFDIQDSDTEGTLTLICKTFLKMNQAIDCGDMDGFQKLARSYDSLRKSAKFTAVQNKEKTNDFIGSVGELVDYCEREGGAIPKFEIDEPYDRIDKIIDDLKAYNKSLVYSDTTLSSQIEDYLKRRSILDQRRADKELNQGKISEITDDDYIKHSNRIQREKIRDQVVYNES